LFTTGWHARSEQEAQPRPAVEPAAKPTEKETAAHPAQIELLETNVRFEVNGDSRKEVHALVKINSELGVRQFAQLNFDFNRSFESVEIPMVHITHANRGTSDILPSAVTDHPNPAVVNAPAYQDVRVKSVRILGLEPGDTLEYRVLTTTMRAPLAPDFWLDHSFDRTGVVSDEVFRLDLPAGRIQIRINPETPPLTEKSGEGESARISYRWDVNPAKLKPRDPETSAEDIALTTFSSWSRLSNQLARTLPTAYATTIYSDAEALANSPQGRTSLEVWYTLIAQKLPTLDVPFDLKHYVSRGPQQILDSRYGTSEEKARLLSVLMTIANAEAKLYAYSESSDIEEELPRPSLLSGFVLEATKSNKTFFLDPGLEVAPFGMLPAKLRGKKALEIKSTDADSNKSLITIPQELPFPASQQLTTHSAISAEGTLTSRVAYRLRGDNELVLREVFHKTPKERWKEVAQLLSLTDGFRGQVISVNASDPYATKEPFTVEYELDQPKFVDWSKKTVRIPALLPQLGLPDPPAKPASGSATAPIDLGTPLEVETKMTLQLPPGTSASAPAGTSVDRDYATYSSQYSVNGSTLTATRHIKFILREVPAARAADYNAFLRAVQNDETQDFTLEQHNSSEQKTNSAAPNTPTPPKPAAPKP